jgi:hypothetical protein
MIYRNHSPSILDISLKVVKEDSWTWEEHAKAFCERDSWQGARGRQPSVKVFPDAGWEISIYVIQKRPDSLKCRSNVIYIPVQDVGVPLGSLPSGEEIVP